VVPQPAEHNYRAMNLGVLKRRESECVLQGGVDAQELKSGLRVWCLGCSASLEEAALAPIGDSLRI
jgi:hypothetical protein